MATSSLTVGPAQGQLLLRTSVQGKAARMGHALTLLVREWQCVAELDAGVPVATEAHVHLSSLAVLRGDGGVKPLSDNDRRKILAGAARTLGPTSARFTSSGVSGRWVLDGALDLHGVKRPHTVHVAVAERGDDLQIVATTSVLQTAHGITPYSQMMGALQVVDRVSVLLDVTVPRP